MKNLPITIVQIKRNGLLINSKALDKIKMDTLMELMTENDEVEVTYEIKHKDGSYSQLSRLHASIRALANENGASFNDMKKEVKRRCGLVNVPEPIKDEDYKSFGSCSKEELGKAIQECITIGDFLSVNLH